MRTKLVLFTLVILLTRAISASAATESAIYSFGLPPDGAGPYGTLVSDLAGNLYGTAVGGGTFGNGTVFELSPVAGGGWSETTLYSFGGSPDGAFPYGGLVFDKLGNLYGTTGGGGSGYGTVFELTPSGSGWGEEVIYPFRKNGQNDGYGPQAGLAMDTAGNLYGTTYGGGSSNAGTVFQLSPSGNSWNETVIWSFNVSDGSDPQDLAALDKAGNVYVTTYSGGTYGYGSVVKLSYASGSWNGASIFSFTGGDNGCLPTGGVIVGPGEKLYGTTSFCGDDNVGTVFKLTPTIGQWSLSILHTFTGGNDGAEPVATLIQDRAGNLYGTAFYGGLFGVGTVFKLAANDDWKEYEYSFVGDSTDGGYPHSGLILRGSALFGTTAGGGTNATGTVYEIALN